MSGTVGGAKAAARTNKAKDPKHYQKIGRKGGRTKGAKGFSVLDPLKHQELSRKGGRASRKSTKEDASETT